MILILMTSICAVQQVWGQLAEVRGVAVVDIAVRKERFLQRWIWVIFVVSPVKQDIVQVPESVVLPVIM